MACLFASEQIHKKEELIKLNESEEKLVGAAIEQLRECNPQEADIVGKRFEDLRALGDAISRFPSVRDSQSLRGIFRDGDTLAQSLRTFSRSSRLLHTPTRIVAARSYLVAKTHAFSLLSMVSCDIPGLQDSIRSVVFSIVCSLMAEDVYLACLDDQTFPNDKKDLLAADLVRLWDSGSDPRASEHVPALQSLWAARDAAPPIFGTMDGSSEMIRISLDMGEDWQDFLLQKLHDIEIRSALEEFLFGLSYEEINNVRMRLVRFGISSVGKEEVRSYLGNQPNYSIVVDSDPRCIYDFYVERRDATVARIRDNKPGPKKPLEELYLMHRMAVE